MVLVSSVLMKVYKNMFVFERICHLVIGMRPLNESNGIIDFFVKVLQMFS